MCANTNSRLNAEPVADMRQETAPDGEARINGSTLAEMNSLSRDVRPFRWSPDAVRRLDEEVEWALTSNPTGAAEIAGVLLGRSGPTLEITDCQPVLLMRPQDHAYALAGPGRREFERTTAAFPAIAQDGLSVVGFYRSHIGDGCDLTEDEFGLIRTCFRHTSQVVLLIKLAADGSSTVRLFLGDDGQALSEFHCSGDPSALPRWLELWQNLSVDDLPHTATPADTIAAAMPTDMALPVDTPGQARAGLRETPIRASEEAQGEASRFKRPSNLTQLTLLVAAILLTVLVGYPLFKGSAKLNQGSGGARPAAHQVDSGSSHDSGLALRAERQGDDLRLDWDRHAAVLVSATGGMLTIRDGNGRNKEVMIDGNLLRAGSVIYRPLHGEVFFRLVIFGSDGTRLGESVTTSRGNSGERE